MSKDYKEAISTLSRREEHSYQPGTLLEFTIARS